MLKFDEACEIPAARATKVSELKFTKACEVPATHVTNPSRPIHGFLKNQKIEGGIQI